MSKFFERVAGLTCLGVLLVLGAVILDSAGPLLPSFQAGADKEPIRPEQLKREEQLAADKATLQRSREAELQVAEELIAGRLSLAEAIEQFRALEQAWPQFAPYSEKAKLLWKSEDARLGDRVLWYVWQVLADTPDEQTAVCGYLNKELQELLASRQKRPAAPAESWIKRGR
jgi:hypothetical protein